AGSSPVGPPPGDLPVERAAGRPQLRSWWPCRTTSWPSRIRRRTRGRARPSGARSGPPRASPRLASRTTPPTPWFPQHQRALDQVIAADRQRQGDQGGTDEDGEEGVVAAAVAEFDPDRHLPE